MTKKDQISLILGAGLGFLAWYLMRGNAPALNWTVNRETGLLQPAPVNRWDAALLPYETSITPVGNSPYVTEISRAGPAPAPYASWEAYDRARIISGRSGGASGAF